VEVAAVDADEGCTEVGGAVELGAVVYLSLIHI